MSCTNHPDVIEGLKTCARCSRPFCPSCVVDIRGETYCGECKEEQVKDLRSGVDTGSLPLASIGRRFGAVIVDWLIVGIPLTLLNIAILFSLDYSLLDPENQAPFVTQFLLGLPWLVVWVLYEGLLLKARGQTVGKMALKIKVVTLEGENISGGQASTRALARALLNYAYIIDPIPALFTKEKLCVHDMLAKTRVVDWCH